MEYQGDAKKQSPNRNADGRALAFNKKNLTEKKAATVAIPFVQ